MRRFISIIVLSSALSGWCAEAPAPPATNKLGPGVLANPPQPRPPFTPPAQRPKFVLRDDDRVMFLGDTFMEREQLESYIETMLTLRFPTNKIIFRNIGWSADTPLGESRAGFDPPEKGFNRLKEHIAAVKPTVVFLSHSLTASFGGIEALPKFEGDMRTLVKTIEDIAGKDVRLVFIGPIVHEKLPPPLPEPSNHNEQLRWYNAAVRKLAVEKNAFYVDLMRDMSPAAMGQAQPPWTDNGIHLTPFGYWRIARTIEFGLGIGNVWR